MENNLHDVEIEEYWLNYLSGDWTSFRFPSTSETENQTSEASSVKAIIPSQTFDKIVQICQEDELNVFTYFLTALHVVLNRYTRESHFLIGTSSFKLEDEDDSNGLLLLHNQSNLAIEFKQLLGEVMEGVNNAYDNQGFDYITVAEKLKIRTNIELDQFFNVALLYKNINARNEFMESFDMILSLSEENETPTLELDFDSKKSHFSEAAATNFLQHVIQVIVQVTEEPGILLSSVGMCTIQEHNELLSLIPKSSESTINQTTVDLFSEKASAFPKNIAVSHQSTQLTYQQLDQLSNNVAQYLIENCAIESNDLVGIMVEPSDWLIVGLLGILKSGAAFVPIDPENPQDRIDYIIQDSKPKGIIVASDDMFSLGEYSGHIFAIDIQLEMLEDVPTPTISTKLDDLLYVIYTSGTTGKPKGTKINQRSFLNYIQWLTNTYQLSAEDKSVLLSSYAFDLGYTCLWGTLLNGGTIHLVDNNTRKNPEKLTDYLVDNQISFLKITPSLFSLLVQSSNLKKFGNDQSMRLILLGGETFRTSDVDIFKQINNETVFVNHYGPTETTIGTVAHTITNANWEEFKKQPVIGHGIDNAQIYLLDEFHNLVPHGIPGQIFIAGPGLSSGYLNQELLTKEKFIDNPIQTGTLMYGTGDLGRWTTNNTLEFLGREDDQVKIRGYRVETNEIVRTLSTHELVEDVAVITIENSDQSQDLVAYLVNTDDVSIQELRDFLAPLLPEYMIPAHFIMLESIPITSNGKLDKKALPSTSSALTTDSVFEGPRNEIEEQISAIWKEVLHKDQIGIHDNFFVLGGDSIKSVQIASRLLKHNLKMEVADIFEYPTIAEIAPELKQVNIKIDQGIVSGPTLLTPIQHWFFDQKFTDQHHFNQSVMLFAKSGFNESGLTAVFDQLIQHHDILRARFTFESDTNTYVQTIQKSGQQENTKPYQLSVFDFTEKTPDEIKPLIKEEANQIQSSFDIEASPLVHIGLFKTLDGDHLLVAIHHLVIDGVSWRILLDDLKIGFEQYQNEQSITFQDKTSSYQKWAAELYDYAQSPKLQREIAYWQGLESSEFAPLPRNSTQERPKLKNQKAYSVVFSEEETTQVLEQTNKAYRTEINDILLTALALSFKDWTKERQVLIRLEGHGRESISDQVDVTRTIGWFTSSYPTLLDASKAEDLGLQIRTIKENLRKIPSKGIGYEILKRVTNKESKTGLSFNLNPEINFNYLGQFDGSISGPKDNSTDESVKSNVSTADAIVLSGLSSGQSISPESESHYAFNITGLVSGGKLRFTYSYNDNEFKENEVEKLSNLFRINLLQIVDHCSLVEKNVVTPSDYNDLNLSISELDEIKSQIHRTNPAFQIEKIYRLSPMQEGMLFHYLLNKNKDPYYRQLSFQLSGSLDYNLVKDCLNDILQRHDVLRTLFLYDNLSESRQVVIENQTAEIRFEDLSTLDIDLRETALDEIKSNDQKQGFQLSHDLLFRVVLVKVSESEYELVWSYHHILMDGWCLGIIISDFFEMYRSKVFNRTPELPKAYPYSDYINWYNKQDIHGSIDYWRNYLADYNQTAGLPKYKSNQALVESSREEYKFALSQEMTNKLKEFASLYQSTLSNVFQTLWGVMLQKYNNTNDVVFGSIVSGRPTEIEGIEKILGLFINAIPVRVRSEDASEFATLVKQVQESALESGKHDFAPLVDIQANSNLKTELFDHILIFVNYPLEEEVEESGSSKQEGTKIKNVQVVEQTSYNFDVRIVPGSEFSVHFTFDPSVYEKQTFVNLQSHFTHLVQEVISIPDTSISDLQLISKEDENQLVTNAQKNQLDFPMDFDIIQLFESQVEINPDRIAIQFESKSLTFSELNSKSNLVAHTLQKKGVSNETLVGLFTTRSLEKVIGMLGILKAGGAYLPIDPEYPTDRVNYILEDSQVEFLVTQRTLKDTIPSISNLIYLDDADLENSELASNNLGVDLSPEQLAYVIYTSGSTGKPKGVLLEHRNVTSFTNNLTQTFGLEQEDLFLAITTVTFDISVLEILSNLISGIQVNLASTDTVQNIDLLHSAILQQEITALQITPSRLQLILEAYGSHCLEHLNLLLVGGEAMSNTLFETLKSIKKPRIFNVYGPTEATIWSTAKEITSDSNLTIGEALLNESCYILSSSDSLAPIGVPGELCIGGDGIGRGYLNRDELTNERFVPNPFIENQVIYKTGDLARLLPSGEIEFLGRTDDQVKIRGYRIETGEIDQILIQHPSVENALTLAYEEAHDSTQKYLCSYIIGSNDIATNDLRSFLASQVPSYMVSSYFIFLKEFPLMSSGKVNRKALPLPSLDGLNSDIHFEHPKNESEEILQTLWSEILRLDQSSIGRTSNFFEMGGHSLKAMQLFGKIKQQFGVVLSFASLFENPTIEHLASEIQKSNGSLGKNTLSISELTLKKAKDKEQYLATKGQINFYQLQQRYPNSTLFNMPSVIPMGNDVDPILIKKVLNELVERHEALRTQFEEYKDSIYQKIIPFDQIELDFKHEKVKNDLLADFIKTYSIPFDLNKAPLIRTTLLQTESQGFYLLNDLSHLIFDGTSINILKNDFKQLYVGGTLDNLDYQFKDFSEWQNELLQSPEIKIHEDYWLEHLGNKLAPLSLPTDFERSTNPDFSGKRVSFFLGEKRTELLRNFNISENSTLFITLLTAFNIILSKRASTEDVIIGSPIAGRKHPELEKTIGLFLGTLLIRNQPNAYKSFAQFLNEVKQHTLNAFEHQDYPYELLLDQLDYPSVPGRNPITDYALIVQNMHEKANVRSTNKEDGSKHPIFEKTVSKMDLTMYVYESNSDIELAIEYKSSLFKESTISEIFEQFLCLLDHAIKQPQVALADLNLTTFQNSNSLSGITHAQKRILNTEHFNPNTGVNNTPFCIRYDSILDQDLLAKAFELVIESNDALRLQFSEIEGIPDSYQFVSGMEKPEFSVQDFSGVDGDTLLEDWLSEEGQKHMPVLKNNLFQFSYLSLPNNKSAYYLNLHHLIGDGWTFFLICQQIDEAYQALKKGLEYKPTNPSYMEYVAEERIYLNSDAFQSDQEFWETHLFPLPERMERVIPAIKDHNAGIQAKSKALLIPAPLRSKILDYVENNNSSIYKVIFAALSYYISRIEERKEVVIGSVNHGRTSAQNKDTAGMFVSTFPVKSTIDSNHSFQKMEAELSEQLNVIVKNHTRYPYDLLAQDIRSKSSSDPNYLLDINLIGHPDMEEDRYKMQYVFPGSDSSPLSIHINESNKNIHGELELSWAYQIRYFSEEEIDQMHLRLCTLMENLLVQQDLPLSKISLISEPELACIQNEWNNASWEYAPGNVVMTFEEQVRQNPKAIALRFQDDEMSYEELNNKANQLGQHLIQFGASGEQMIALLLEPGFDMIISILAVLKSGAAYIPIDPKNPETRIATILEDAQPICSIVSIERESYGVQNIDLSTFEFKGSDENLSTPILPEQAAYVIYTSGTTGLPKGCIIEHRNLISYIQAFQNEFKLNTTDVVLQQTQYTFDAFVEEMYPTLLSGGCMVIAKRAQVTDIAQLNDLIRANSVTLITCSPLLLNELNQEEPFTNLRYVISGGDVLKYSHIDHFLKYTSVYNTYGPTEATVCATYQPISNAGKFDDLAIKIGKPILGTQTYVLDSKHQLLPKGVSGQLAIAGTGVARGYLNRTDLTEQKFIHSPLDANDRWYLTGDLVQWGVDGTLEFLGRTDDQVKIRGFRIEPGEIEKILDDHANVDSSLVMARKNDLNEAYLCAYYIGKEDSEILSSYLKTKLPAYMIPAFFVQLDTFPLNNSGKVNRNALPSPNKLGAHAGLDTIASTRYEDKLLIIWKELLVLEQIGLDQNFFDLGGHSLKANMLSGKILQELELKVSLSEIFSHSTIRGLAALLESKTPHSYAQIAPIPKQAHYELSNAQKRLWFINEIQQGKSPEYNISTAYSIKGKLNVDVLQLAFNLLVERHESLRTTFETIDNVPKQIIHDQIELELEFEELQNTTDSVSIVQSKTAEFRSWIFDLTKAPLIKLKVIKLAEDEFVFLINLHHIICDGWSIQIMTKEVFSFYKSLLANKTPIVKPLSIQYKEYAAWQNSFVNHSSNDLMSYWKQKLGPNPEPLKLATDFERPTNLDTKGQVVRKKLSEADTQAFQQIASKHGVSNYTLMIACIKVLLVRYCNQEEIVIGSISAGRNHPDLFDQLGFFVNSVVLKDRILLTDRFSQVLNNVKRTVLESMDYGSYPFDLLVKDLEVKSEKNRNPLFDVAVNMTQSIQTRKHSNNDSLKPQPNEGLALDVQLKKSEEISSKFDLLFNLVEAEQLIIGIDYNVQLFKDETIAKILDQLLSVIDQITNNPEITVARLKLMEDEIDVPNTNLEAMEDWDFEF